MANFLSTQAYKGTRDFYPSDMRFRNWMFDKVCDQVRSFGYGEYGGPMLEPFELYAAKTGDEIVNQQLYSFTDRGDRKVAIRPEMTPTLARLVAAKVFELPKPVRLFCFPNFMRYERPQRGRLREFWQLNVDVLGGDTLLADAEILSVAGRILESFGGASHAQIKVNHRKLVDHVFGTVLALDAEKSRALSRLIDAKDKLPPDVYRTNLSQLGMTSDQEKALTDFHSLPFAELVKKFPCEGAQELEALLAVIKDMKLSIPVVFDASVMRGLDYYTGMVFEVFDVSPENNRAMFGGGRYDNLVGMFGKHQLSGVGFGMGDVTLQNFLETHKLVPNLGSDVDVFVASPSREHLAVSESVAHDLRVAGLRVASALSFEGFGAQLKAASKLGARYAVLLGEDELKRNEVIVKDLASGQQSTVARSQIAQKLCS
ncbi:MAG: histidine--tRNA ligase [Bdellovibrionales bacterium]|nr:histidine--tRNA ligase [Bdellovibrionales bacterium]